LVNKIKNIYNVLASLEGGRGLEEPVTEKVEETGAVKKPSIQLKNIVTSKHVVCLQCGKKLKTLKRHLEKAHGLKPKEYYQRFNLDPKKGWLVCKDYSKTRSQMAKDRGLGALGGRKKASN
jgi:predicted transcriptional regulator